jgi:NAD(P)-dependent dehydrogenase (short-subunit alcohol dehydrogenase family)
MKDQVWFVTGTSTGLGRALVEELIAQGYPVVATARKLTALDDLPEGEDRQVLKVALDVTDKSQVTSSVKQAQAQFGKIDVLVNNAGYGYFGAIEESDEQEVRNMMETNFWGASAMAREVLPDMRAKKSGHIINVTSIGGLATFPAFGYYHATKFAMEGLFQSLATQVEPLGIHVTNVEPGAFRTEWSGASHKGAEDSALIEDYVGAHQARATSEKGSGSQEGDPKLAAKAMIKIANVANPPIHYLFGQDAYTLATSTFEDALKEFKEYEDDSINLKFGDDSYWD